jgi:hypothetical protein
VGKRNAIDSWNDWLSDSWQCSRLKDTGFKVQCEITQSADPGPDVLGKKVDADVVLKLPYIDTLVCNSIPDPCSLLNTEVVVIAKKTSRRGLGRYLNLCRVS